MQIGICSYSFHRVWAAGQMDFRRYVEVCKELGCTQLDPWNAHLSELKDPRETLSAGRNPGQSHHLAVPSGKHVDQIRAVAKAAGVPFGTIAIDGAHIYEPTESARQENRKRAYGWLDVASTLGAKQARIDAGGPEEMPEEILAVIVEGYRDVIARARPLGIQILVENHWGPTLLPRNVQRLMEAVEGLGLLFDTRNWKPGHQQEAIKSCPKFARATHVKTGKWDAQGNEGEDVAEAVSALRSAGYAGVWGIESVPTDGDEIGGARRTIELLKPLMSGSARQ